MKKIHRVIINGRFLTQSITGVQRTACELVKALDHLIEKGVIDNNKYQFTVLYSGELINELLLKHIPVVRKGILKGNLWEQFELPLYSSGALLISMCNITTLFKKKQILIVHDASFIVNPQFFSFAFRTWYKFVVPTLGKIVKQIITVSQFSKQELVKHANYKAEKVKVIYNAADHILHFAEPSNEFKVKVEEFKPYCLSVSSVSANKNFSGLARAIAKIDFLDYSFLMAGGVSSTLKKVQLPAAANFLGYVSNSELSYLYRNASLFIFPSFYEGFGIPPLEAMISGCPVLASNSSSLPEVLEDACEYFNPYNENELAERLQKLLENKKKLNDLKAKGIYQAKKYSWKYSALNLYESVKEFA